MKTALVGTAMGLLLAGAAVQVGCFHSADDCERNPILGCGSWTVKPDAGGGNGGQGGTGGDGGMGDGGGGGVVGNCDPGSGAVDEGCGVFASSSLGVAGNDGSKGKPLASLAAAVAAAPEGGKVYACGEAFAEAVVVDKAVTIYGGLDCAGGGWNLLAETRTTVDGPSDVVGLRVEATASGTVIQDLEVRAADATVAGGSSIGVLVDGADVELVRCGVTAGAGAKGVDGADGPSVAPMQGPAGNPGLAACSNGQPILGGNLVTNDCGGGALSIGGNGGNGNDAVGGNGGDGLPAGAAGQGGKGEVNAGWSCAVGGTNGGANPGDNGAPGTLGVGATGPGTLSSNGYTGTSGTAGLPGGVGQGGGGGGGAKGGAAICMGMAGAGASGGAGGAGGCGGLPGEGAGPGGASFALVSVNASVTLTECVLTSGSGGIGGVGGDSQAGGSGGLAGAGGAGSATGGGSSDACAGGQGGKGGAGGPGGGGLGGPSAPIAHVGGVPESTTSTLMVGSAGLGGPGGNGNAQGNAGADGVSGAVIGF